MDARQQKIRSLIAKANKVYRTSSNQSPLSDSEYDYLMELIDDEEFRSKVGIEVVRNKTQLPIKMGSLNKIKTIEEVQKWKKSHKIDEKTQLIFTPKFDGLSLLVKIEKGSFAKAYTRGDGIIGQDVTEHFRNTRLGYISMEENFDGYLIGEAIMESDVFDKKYQKKFKNPRNMVAGMLSRKEVSQELKDISFLAFSIYQEGYKMNKEQEVELCNRYNNWFYSYELKFIKTDFINMNEKIIDNYMKREKRFQCDGVVISINDKTLQEQLGNETGRLNPAWARAWKPENSNVVTSEVLDVMWHVSKQGYQKPVVNINPVELAGVTVSNVTGINARFILDNKIGQGSVISIIRAGDVIPKIINVVLPSDKKNIVPEKCQSCQSSLLWNDSQIELQCKQEDCPEKIISSNIDFFKILEIEEIAEGTVRQFYNKGYKSIKDILSLKLKDILDLEGFGEKKAIKILQAITDKTSNIPLEKIQHASNFFKGLGTKKLALVRRFDSLLNRPSIKRLLEIEGFSQILSTNYLDAFDSFWHWVAELPISIAPYKEKIKTGGLLGKKFVFSGFRDVLLEQEIQDNGGSITSSISSKTYALIVKDKNASTSKIEKAKKFLVNIFDREELQKKLFEIKSK